MRTLVIALSIVLVATRQLAAQFPPDVAVGTRVRVILPDSLRQAWGPRVQSLTGEIAALAADTLYLRMHATGAAVPIGRTTIKRIDRSLGMPGRPESAIRGAFLGAFWTAIYWAAIREAEHGRRSGADFADDLAEGAALGAAAGFVLGAIFPTERWRRVHLR